MSAKIMGQVWDLKLSPAERIVLLAMADHADHDGNNVRPSIRLIVWKTDYSERQVKRIIKDLRDAGILVVTQGATPTTPYHYRIDLSAGIQKEPFQPSHRGVKMSPHDRGVKMSPGDIAMSLGGDAGDTPRGDIAMSPKPSVEPSMNRKDRAPRKSADTPPTNGKEPSPHQAIVQAYADALGYPIADGAATGAAAKKLISMGYTPEQVAACYRDEKKRDFWKDKHLSLQSLAKCIGAWAQSRQKKVERAAPPPYQPRNHEPTDTKRLAEARAKARESRK